MYLSFSRTEESTVIAFTRGIHLFCKIILLKVTKFFKQNWAHFQANGWNNLHASFVLEIIGKHRHRKYAWTNFFSI